MKKYTRKRITKMLEKVGACWAFTDEKHLRADDPDLFIKKKMKSYHIFPDSNHSEGYGILRFRNLTNLGEYLKKRIEDGELQSVL